MSIRKMVVGCKGLALPGVGIVGLCCFKGYRACLPSDNEVWVLDCTRL